VDEVGSGTIVLDTRKTAPGLRELDKDAVALGGATNHRLGLYDGVLIKDTHRALVPSITEGVARAVAAGHPRERITIEVRSVDEVREAMAAGAGRALLDNMSLSEMAEAVRAARGRIVLEASGGLRPGSLHAVAATGVDALSIGALTHSVRAADLAMEMEQEAAS
jgi:nicotinate-nucleotide pyrophosphorylase (carboxylating)